MKLTKRVVDATQGDGEEVLVWDDEVPGFGLRIHASGRKAFTFQYRRDGRTRRISIGLYGVWTVDKARVRARELRASVDRGGDPSHERGRDDKKTFNELADLYLTRHARRFKKPKSLKEDERNLRLYLRPTFGRRRVVDIKRADVEGLHSRLGGKPVTANRVLALLSMMMNLAERWELREPHTNPTRGVSRYKEKNRKRFLSPAELERVGRALTAFEREKRVVAPIVAALRVLIFTGARTAEILGLKWSEVDLDRGCLRLPDSKTGAKVVPLNTPALEIIAKQPRKSAWVFASPGQADAPIDNVRRAWGRIRKSAGVPDVTVHDLRHSFAAVLAEGRESLVLIGSVLGHKSPQTTARYAHLADQPQKRAVERAGKRITAAMAATRTTAEVIPLPTDRRKKEHRRQQAGAGKGNGR